MIRVKTPEGGPDLSYGDGMRKENDDEDVMD